MLRFAWRVDARLVFLYYATAVISALAPLAAGVTLSMLIDHSVVGTNAVTVPLVLVVVVATHFTIVAVTAAIQYGLHYQYYDYLLRYRLQDAFSYRFCERLCELDVAHFENAEVQALITKTRDTHQWRLPDFFRSVSETTSALVGVVSSAIALVVFGWWIIPIVLAGCFPRLWFRMKFGDMAWSMYGSGAPEARKLWYFSWLLSESSVLRELKVFRSAPALLDRFREIQARIFELGKRPLDRFRRVSMIAPLVEGALVFAIAWLVLPDVTSGAISVGSYAFFITMLQQLAMQTSELGGRLGATYENILYVRHWNELMALSPIVETAPDAIPIPNPRPPRIEFRDVSFAYPSGRQALKSISFTIEPGESIALVGANGAGKSTIIKLLCRFYDVTSGEILVDGVDLRKLDLASWYAHLGTLFQDFVQYRLSVRDNVLLGDPRRIDETAMRTAIAKAGASGLVAELPGGYDQILGTEFEDGEQLSGGQWQKLAIARAFYQAAPILIMDEPTSAIDAEAEYEIFENLEAEYREKTLILVSHRFSTVRNADRIFVIEDGTIVESGTHEALLEKAGRYAAMFSKQAEGYR